MAMPKGWKPGSNNNNSDQEVSSPICTQCKNVCRPGTRFCTNCGHNLDDITTNKNNTTIFDNKEFGIYELSKHDIKIQIAYPMEWQIVDHKTEGVSKDGIAFYLVKDSPIIINIVFIDLKIKTQDFIQNSSLAWNTFINNKGYQPGQLISSEVTTIDNRHAMKIIERSIDGSEAMTMAVNILLDTENVCIMYISYSTESSVYNKADKIFYEYLPIFEYVLSSIKFSSKYESNNHSLSQNYSTTVGTKIPEKNTVDELIKLSNNELPAQLRLEKSEEYVKSDPTNALAWNAKGYALNELEKHDEAIESYDQAIKLDSKCFLAMYNKANLLLRMDRDDEAITLFGDALKVTDEIISNSPNDYVVWRTKGLILSDLDRYDNAIECFDNAIKLSPTDHYSWSMKGFALTQLEKYYEAMDCIDKAIELYPKDPIYWNYKAILYGLLEKYDKELECHDKILELDPTDYVNWNNKAFVLENLERLDEALKCYEKSLEVDPQNIETLNKKVMYCY